MRFWTESLVARLVASFLIFSLVTVCVAGLSAYLRVRETLTASVFERLTLEADLKEKEIVRWVEDRRAETLFLSQLPLVQSNADVLLGGREDDPEYRAAYALLARFLAFVVEQKPDVREIMILTDVGGKILLSTRRSHEGDYRVDDRYFIQGRLGTFVQKVYAWPVTLEPTITVSTPLRNAQGYRSGVLAINLNLDRMDAIIAERTGMRATEETYLVDRFNNFVSARRFGRQEFPRGVHAKGIDVAVQGASGLGLYRNYRGVPVVGVYRWLADLDLALLAEVGQREAFEPASRLGVRIVATGMIMALVLAVGIYLLARQIARPVLALADTAVRASSGDLSVQAPVLTRDELGLLAVSFNRMTDRLKGLYDTLRASEEKYRAIVDQTPIGVVIHRDGKILFANDGIKKMLGYDPLMDVTNRPVLDFVPPQNRGIVRRLAAQRQEGRVHEFYETMLLTAGGGLKNVLIGARLLMVGAEGTVLFTLTDITDLKKTQDALRQAKDDLEAQNARLRELDRLKDTLIRDVSHELKTPVAKQAMQLEMLRTTLGNGSAEEIEKIIQVMDNSVQRQQQVIRNLLDLSRLEAGGRKYARGPIRLDEHLRGLIEDYRASINTAGLTLVAELRPLIVLADAEMLWHVFSNLLNNAVKYRRKDLPGTITIAMVGDGHEGIVSISDDGVGLEPADLPQVFDRFFQASASAEGAGVGLTIAKKMIENMGGSITLASEGRGLGAVATVRLPVGPDDSIPP